ncbi:MAG: hypothetical protein ACJATA_000238 [Sphingobacteriales bacterium]|jgi:hypothetical protein
MEYLLNLIMTPLTIFGMKPFHNDFWELIARYGFNLIFVFLVVRVLYYRQTRNAEYSFVYFMINTLIFFVCHLLASVKIETGFALGLFAIFSIMRYRTDAIPIKEMSFLFVVIALAVINSLTNKKISIIELAFSNIAIFSITWILYAIFNKPGLLSKTVIYEKIENIKPQNYNDLLSDLSQRTGLEIESAEILRTDFLRDVARVKIYYKLPEDEDNSSTR